MSDFNTTISFDVFNVSLSFVDEGTFVVVKQYVDEQLDSKQDTLIAGDNITIIGNVISATVSESSVSATGAPLYLSNEDSDVLGYKKIKSTPDTAETIQTITLTTTEQLIRTYLYDLPISVTTLAAGNWLASVIGKISNAAGTSKLRVEAFLRHLDGNETTLFSKESTDINNLDYEPISSDFAGNVYSCLVTDRLGFRVYGVTSGANRTLTTKIGDGNLSYFSTPLSVRHDQTRDKNGNPDFLHVTQAEKDAFIKTSEDFENMVANAIGCTRNELVAARDAGELTPGASYRITDYITTSAQVNTAVGGHQFDVIVTAVSPSELSENASAVQHGGDTYFSNAKVEAWEIKYCLDNDTNRFAWADSVNGKGVIYYMKDERDNECPYDFKNILFLRDGVYYYTFSALENTTDELIDLSMQYSKIPDDYPSSMSSNTMEPAFESLEVGGVVFSVQTLNFNIMLSHYDEGSLIYGASDNKFGLNCKDNFFNGCDYVQSNVFGNSCYSNVFGNTCYSNVFGNNCYSNVFGNNCYSNVFGDNCGSNVFGNNCGSNKFVDYCQSNKFGVNCGSNTFGNNCYSNKFGDSCSSNVFGDNCIANEFGYSCYSNTFSYNCYSNNFYDGLSGTTKKNYIRYIVLEGYVCNNNFYSNLTTSASDYLQRIRIKGLENATPTDTIITLPTTNTKYEWLICYTSGGVLKQYCPNDLTNNQTYKIEDTSVSTWAASTKYVDFAFEAQINIADLSESDFVNVVFGVNEANSGNYAAAIEQYAGYILVFSKVNTAITIPTISVTKIDL